jgi:uncharacterized protein YfaT (DUF1175 family)
MSPPLASLSQPTLACLIQDALAHLRALGYSAKYTQRCRSVWTAFVRFAAHEPLDEGDAVVLVSRFLASRGLPPPSPGTLSSHQRMIQARHAHPHGVCAPWLLPTSLPCHAAAHAPRAVPRRFTGV